MAEIRNPTAIGPQAYERWRATSLGSLTEILEERLVLALIGDLSNTRFLDAGCGDGALLCAAAARGAEVTGVDPDHSMLSAARKRLAAAGVRATLLEGRVEQLPFPNASFDVVAANTVLCFVSNASSAVREMARVLRPGGRLVLGELGRWSVWAGRRRIRGWLGDSTWRAARFRSIGELRALAAQAGLSIAASRGAVFYPPIGMIARILAPLDSRLGRFTTLGAAFIAVSAVKT
ncbi:MAG: class I SAM-dependent methyltransferase [Reyranellales bacterium]|jgi:ubiquinone/menaquinone biosynthesis C-methylase UbiE